MISIENACDAIQRFVSSLLYSLVVCHWSDGCGFDWWRRWNRCSTVCRFKIWRGPQGTRFSDVHALRLAQLRMQTRDVFERP